MREPSNEHIDVAMSIDSNFLQSLSEYSQANRQTTGKRKSETVADSMRKSMNLRSSLSVASSIDDAVNQA